MVFKLLGRWVGAGDGQSCLTGWFALGWRLLGREFGSPKHVDAGGRTSFDPRVVREARSR